MIGAGWRYRAGRRASAFAWPGRPGAVHSVRAAAATLIVSVAMAGMAAAVQDVGQGTPARIEYAIGPEDVLDIAVWNNTDISRTVPVRPDGKISLPLLNDVQAAGVSPA